MQVPTFINNEEYLTAAEAAAFLGYSREYFRTVITPRHKLKTYQKGLRKTPILYKKSDLEPLAGIRPADDELSEKA